MKKILLVAVTTILIYNANAQGVLGTHDNRDFDFETNGIFRAKWLANGPLIFGDVSDPDASHYARKTVFSSSYDLYMDNDSHIFLKPGLNVYSGAYRSATNRGYLTLYHPSDGSAILNSYSGEIFLQPDNAGTVWVAKPYSYNLPTQADKMHVNGSTYSIGYAADIKTISSVNYLATNDDYTLLADATSNSVTFTLPSGGASGVSNGRIFVIKNINGSNTVTVNSVDGTNISLSPMESIMVQYYESSSAYYVISRN